MRSIPTALLLLSASILVYTPSVESVSLKQSWKDLSASLSSVVKRSSRQEGATLQKRAVNKTVYISAKTYQGETFFDEWDFYDGADYTHGLVDYVDRDTAFRTGLAYVTEEGLANMHVDSWTNLTVDQVNSGTKLRQSVRISSQARFNKGLFILDVAKAPYGCSTWPAYWTTNENWPNDGEIDIIENVHTSKSNQVSWHTTEGCVLSSPGNYTGTVGSSICDHNYLSNTGCGIVDPSIASFGATFNEKGGGVYAMKWDSDSIDVWFFYRSAIPDDILEGLPNPANWPLPSASLSSKGCPIDQYFRNHQIIFDTTLCGDWAGTSYSIANCPGTCPEQVALGSNFVNATWSINYIRIYNKTIINTAYLDAGAESVLDRTWLRVATLFFTAIAGLTGLVLWGW